MVLFINDIKINIKKAADTVNQGKYQSIFSTFDHIEVSKFKNNVLLVLPKPSQARSIFDVIEKEVCTASSVTIICHSPKTFLKTVFEDFKFLKAGGGIVQNDKNQLLMIYRNGFWDFPKGKLEKGESIENCSEREVEEECGVKVKIINRICKTRHTYKGSKKRIFKTTYWYRMTLLDDTNIAPQTEEGIEKVEWKSIEEVNECLKTSFNSLQHLFCKYNNSLLLD